jgi:tetratricopeptide (TPR) repeat protein
LRRSTDFLSFFNLGVCMTALERPDSARVCYATSMTLNPGYVPAIVNLASFHFDRKNFDEALRLFRLALRLRPTTADLTYKVGLCFQQLQQWSLAKECFQAASTLNPMRSDFVAQLGYTYFFTRQYDSCSFAYQKAITLDSTNSYYHLNLALAYSSLDSTKSAAREYQKAIDLRHPEELARIYNQLAGLYFRTGQFPKAIASYRKALENDPQNLEAGYYLSVAYDRVADVRNAGQSFKKFLTIAPADTSYSAWKQKAKERIRQIERKAGKR